MQQQSLASIAVTEYAIVLAASVGGISNQVMADVFHVPA
jgi:hypothetical protein